MVKRTLNIEHKIYSWCPSNSNEIVNFLQFKAKIVLINSNINNYYEHTIIQCMRLLKIRNLKLLLLYNYLSLITH